MLVLTRKQGEALVIDNAIKVTVISVMGNKVRLGIEAPNHVRILRAELGSWRHALMGSDKPLNPAIEWNPDGTEVVGAGVNQKRPSEVD